VWHTNWRDSKLRPGKRNDACHGGNGAPNDYLPWMNDDEDPHREIAPQWAAEA
jgi:hypothetical protein